MQYEYLARTFEGIIKPMIPIRTQTAVYSPKNFRESEKAKHE